MAPRLSFEQRQVLSPFANNPFASPNSDPPDPPDSPDPDTNTPNSPVDDNPFAQLTSAAGSFTSSLGNALSSALNPSPSDTSSSSTALLTSGAPTSSSTPSPSPTPTPTPTPTPSTTPTSTSTSPTQTLPANETTFVTTEAGGVLTVTSTLPNAIASPTATKAPPKSFLENKPLAGTVFALAGLVALVLLVSLSTFAVRRSRKRRLDREVDFTSALPPPTTDFSSPDFFSEKFEPSRSRSEMALGGFGGSPGSGAMVHRETSGRSGRSTRESIGAGSEEGLIGAAVNSGMSGSSPNSRRNYLNEGNILPEPYPLTTVREGTPQNFMPLPAPPGQTGGLGRQPSRPQNPYSNPYGTAYDNTFAAYNPYAAASQPLAYNAGSGNPSRSQTSPYAPQLPPVAATQPRAAPRRGNTLQSLKIDPSIQGYSSVGSATLAESPLPNPWESPDDSRPSMTLNQQRQQQQRNNSRSRTTPSPTSSGGTATAPYGRRASTARTGGSGSTGSNASGSTTELPYARPLSDVFGAHERPESAAASVDTTTDYAQSDYARLRGLRIVNE